MEALLTSALPFRMFFAYALPISVRVLCSGCVAPAGMPHTVTEWNANDKGQATPLMPHSLQTPGSPRLPPALPRWCCCRPQPPPALPRDSRWPAIQVGRCADSAADSWRRAAGHHYTLQCRSLMQGNLPVPTSHACHALTVSTSDRWTRVFSVRLLQASHTMPST